MKRHWVAILAMVAVTTVDTQGVKEIQHRQMIEIAQQVRTLRASGLAESDAFAALEAQYALLSAEMGGDDPGQLLADGQPDVDGRRRVARDGVAIVPPAPLGCAVTPFQFTNVVPLAVPTGPAVVASTITVTGAGSFLYDVDVTTFLTHTFAADLDITLRSPAGTVVTLSTDNGAGNDNVFNGTVWDDDANPGGQVPYATNNGLASDNVYVNLTVAGTLTPEEPLGAFIGENPNGVWTITISDDLAGDGGVLNSWRLAISTLPVSPPVLTMGATNVLPVAVPAGPAVVNSTLNIAGAGTVISDVDVTTFLTHTFAADLDITLQSPGGTVVTLSTDNGAGNDNVFNGTVWNDSANPGGQVPYATNNGMATDHAYVNLTLASPLAPEEPLAAFIGENPNGTWTITISDDLAGDGGNLNSWSLLIATRRCAAPLAVGDAYVTPFATPLSVAAPGVLANDNNNGGGAMTAALVAGPSSGAVALNANGGFQYTPNPGFAGGDAFTYRASSGAGPGNVATVNITVSPGAPTTAGDTFSTPYLTTLTVAAPGVLANDSSNGGGPMTSALVTGAASGSVVLNANGGFQYTPNPGFAGADSFTYRASNSVGPGSAAAVAITVNPVAPTTADDVFSTPYLTTLTVAAPGVLVNDSSNGGGTLTALLVSSTSHGTLALSPTGGVSYTPNAGFTGSDSFTYRAVSGVGPGNVATATIAVDAPTTVQPPFNLRVDSVVANTVTLRWDFWPIGPQPSTFVLEGGLGPGDVLASIATGSPSPIYTFVAPTGSFYIRMHGQLDGDKSGPSNEVPLFVNVPVPPSSPANLLGMTDGSTLALTWKNTFGGGAPTGMMLDVTGSLTVSVPIGPTGPFSFAPVPDGSYTFSLRATNAGGAGAASTPVTLDFPAACTGVPGTPANLLAYRLGTTAYVVWDPPTSGPAPTGYVLNVGGAYVGSFSTTGRLLSGAVGPGTYDLSLVATNACGTGGAATTVLVVP